MSYYEKIKLDALEKGIKYISEQKGVSNAPAEELVLHYAMDIWQDSFEPPNDLEWAIEVLTNDPSLMMRVSEVGSLTVYGTLADVIGQSVVKDIIPRLTEVALAAGFESDGLNPQP